MHKLQYALDPRQWSLWFQLWRFLERFTSAAGLIWVLAEFITWMYPTFSSEYLRPNAVYALLLIFFITFLMEGPKTRTSYKLSHRDVRIEVAIADAFSLKGSLIVPTNKYFDFSLGGNIHTALSVQATFQEKFYKDSDGQLSADISKALTIADLAIEPDGSYLIGSTIQLRRNDKIFYWLALTDKRNNNRAKMANQDLFDALPRLWTSIAETADKGVLIVPLLGTGKGRITISREDVAIEIIKSFVAACSDVVFCDKLVIAILPKDVIDHKIDVSKINRYLSHVSEFANYARNTEIQIGKPV